MKKVYAIIFLLAAAITANAQSQAESEVHQLAQEPGGNSVLFANDVVVAPSGLRQHGTSIAVAFNGWVYVATGVETMDSDSSGGLIRMSKDNGFTWTAFASYLYPNVDYIDPEIEVAGTDTNNLALFIACAWYDSISGAADVWVDKYNARNGTFINEVYNESMQYPVRDIDIATDYRSPAWLASPYSVGVLYSHFGSADSIIFVSSGDGGTTWGNRRNVAGTSLYYDHVSLSFGISGSWGNGRYFAAWEERSSFSGTTIGKIKTAHCASTFNGAWTSVFCLDSLDPSLSNVVRRPRISCQYNNSVNNDSNGISALVIFERAYTGDTADCDIIGFFSKTQPATNNWYRFDVANNSYQSLQPDLTYDPGYNNFLLTYYDRTLQALPYFVHDLNMINPNSWTVITTNYCDQPSTLKNPFPRLAINPQLIQAAFSWTRQATPTRDQAMYDAEYMTTEIPETITDAGLALYPNPAQDQSVLEFNLAKTEKLRIDIYNINGQLIMNLADVTAAAGPHRVLIPVSELENGNYFITVTTDSYRKTARLIVAK